MGKITKRRLLARFLTETPSPRIDERVRGRIKAALAPISDSYLRRLLLDTGVPLSPLVEGVRQRGLDELERTLTALQTEYEAASGDRARQQLCRRAVIEGKNHARLQGKDEMVLWMLTWLDNPPLFSTWVKLRRSSGCL